MDEKTMQRLVKQDPSNINSSYIISVFCQDHFKPLIDQYIKKVLVCGKAPKNYQKMSQIQQKVTQLYKTFYFGQPITHLQRQIQLKYLSQKQKKYISHHSIIRQGKKNQYTRCKWRQQDQRILQDMVNFRKTDIQNDDTNFRPFFQPMELLKRLEPIEKMYRLMNISNFYDRYKFNKEIKVYYEISEKYYSFVADKIYNRIHQYINSIQFTNLLKIPPDFMIEMAMYQIHVWLITQRLNQIDTRDSRYISKLILQNFKIRLQLKTIQLNVKKQQLLMRNLNKMLSQNNNVLKFHFQTSNITKPNPYLGIDALVWSILFFQKVPRYSDQVYLFSQYLIKNYFMFQTYTQSDIINGLIQFDAYLVDPKFKSLIQSINPPLSKQQFQQQFDSDKLQKKYHYSQIQKNAKVPIDNFRKVNAQVNITWGEIFAPIRKFFKKYQTLETMDYYDQMEKQQNNQKKKEKQTVWKSKRDQVKQLEKQFKNIKSIRKNRKNWSNLK